MFHPLNIIQSTNVNQASYILINLTTLNQNNERHFFCLRCIHFGLVFRANPPFSLIRGRERESVLVCIVIFVRTNLTFKPSQ